MQSLCQPAPFSDESEAIVERNRIDYSQKITIDLARSGQG